MAIYRGIITISLKRVKIAVHTYISSIFTLLTKWSTSLVIATHDNSSWYIDIVVDKIDNSTQRVGKGTISVHPVQKLRHNTRNLQETR